MSSASVSAVSSGECRASEGAEDRLAQTPDHAFPHGEHSSVLTVSQQNVAADVAQLTVMPCLSTPAFYFFGENINGRSRKL